jgi:predicted nucleic acid-binding protein
MHASAGPKRLWTFDRANRTAGLGDRDGHDVAPDTDQLYGRWRELVRDNAVLGVQVHDARLAAMMRIYGLTHVLTFNRSDFARYADLKAVHPSELVAAK